MATMTELLQSQRDLLGTIRTFVDALRDIKKEKDVDVSVRQAITALPLSASSETTSALDRFRVEMTHAFVTLSRVVRAIDALDQRQSSQSAVARGRESRPVAPAGLLSLRDLSVLQAATEVFFCWSIHPMVARGTLLPVDRRRPTKTLAKATNHREQQGSALLSSMNALLGLLQLPPLAPILLPGYAADVLAVLVAGETDESLGLTVQGSLASQREALMNALPLRLTLASLRAALGQSTAPLPAFKRRCGQLLSQLLIREGGVQATIEVLLAAVDEGNTQARQQVVTLICQCPAGVQAEAYSAALFPQESVIDTTASTGEGLHTSTEDDDDDDMLTFLEDAESYVFLAAVQGLSTLAQAHPDIAIPKLVDALRDSSNHSLERRIKLSEALLFTARRCGDTLPKYAKLFVYAYLDCIRPATRPPARQKSARVALIQEVDPDSERSLACQSAPQDNQDAVVSATLRASCLSNLAEVSAMLGWGLAPYATDVMTCAFGVLQLELDMADAGVVAVRRGAVFLLKYMVQLMGYKLLDVLPEQVRPMYHTLKHVERVDKDNVVRFHARSALEVLDDVMRSELLPRVPSDEAVGGALKMLRIVKH
ncbi:hypothetical protein P43SY_002530 [Pythium insidiosum]|uniref:RNA polymerase II assembly factor Rtp1 C-terminal domain-containing protein n=1 Tax=Pythium insidiosum TaxID=114742 RepID=A0AAD5QD76_PYTIN|nr:hypothetical protein P43SY_002530 [Pythium insidiosum]